MTWQVFSRPVFQNMKNSSVSKPRKGPKRETPTSKNSKGSRVPTPSNDPKAGQTRSVDANEA